MLQIERIILDDNRTIDDVKLDETAVSLSGFIPVTVPTKPGRTFYINKGRVEAIVISDDQQKERMYDFIVPDKVKAEGA